MRGEVQMMEMTAELRVKATLQRSCVFQLEEDGLLRPRPRHLQTAQQQQQQTGPQPQLAAAAGEPGAKGLRRGKVALTGPPSVGQQQQQQQKRTKAKVRRQELWRSDEREALRRALLTFGLGRSEKVRNSMSTSLKEEVRHGVGDIVDASWYFLTACSQQRHTDPKDRAWADKRLAEVARQGGVGQAVALRVGDSDKLAQSGSSWVRRLRLLDHLSDVVRLCASKDTVQAACREIESLRDATLPAAWWDRECDLALLSGVYKLGYGSYDAIRRDPQFSSAFAKAAASPAAGGEGATASIIVQPKRETEGGGESADIRPGTHHGHKAPPQQQLLGGGDGGGGGLAGSALEWPDANSLTRRLKRLVEHLVRVKKGLERPKASSLATAKSKAAAGEEEEEQGDAKGEGLTTTGMRKGVGSSSSELAWSKREKLELVRTLTLWGLPHAAGGGVSWKTVRDKASVRGVKMRSNAEVEAAFEELRSEMLLQLATLAGRADAAAAPAEAAKMTPKQKKRKGVLAAHPSVCPAKRAKAAGKAKAEAEAGTGADIPTRGPANPPAVLTQSSAVKLKERLELMETLRRAQAALGADWGGLRLSVYRSQELPSWWLPAAHDRALAQGVLKHGFGSWAAIFKDPALPFASLGAPSGAAAAAAAAPTATPGGKTLVKRLKYLEKVLHRHLLKMKGRRGPQKRRPAPSAKTLKEEGEEDAPGGGKEAVEDDKERRRERPEKGVMMHVPNKYKYMRAVEVQRHPDGTPVLPLALSERLTLTALGTVEPSRAGFHTERHIFPVGFSTVRDHSSMLYAGQRTMYTNSIVDAGERGAVFRVVPADAPQMVVERDSASGAWVAVCTAVNKAKGIERDKVTISGTEMFGLSHPVVCRLIQELPGAAECANFRADLSFSRYERSPFLLPPLPPSNAPLAQQRQRKERQPLLADPSAGLQADTSGDAAAAAAADESRGDSAAATTSGHRNSEEYELDLNKQYSDQGTGEDAEMMEHDGVFAGPNAGDPYREHALRQGPPLQGQNGLPVWHGGARQGEDANEDSHYSSGRAGRGDNFDLNQEGDAEAAFEDEDEAEPGDDAVGRRHSWVSKEGSVSASHVDSEDLRAQLHAQAQGAPYGPPLEEERGEETEDEDDDEDATEGDDD
eukprot:jgi/Mesen1/8701/ME000052S08124